MDHLSELQRKLVTSKQTVKRISAPCAVNMAAILAINQAELVIRHDHGSNIGPLCGVLHVLDSHASSASENLLLAEGGRYVTKRISKPRREIS